MKKMLALLLAFILALGLFSGCAPKVSIQTGTFTYNSYTAALGNNWNPHSWEDSNDAAIFQYLQTPFVDITIQDSAQQTYQWAFLAATSITDVTAAHQDDLTKYQVTLPAGMTAADVTADYVYEIKLNEKMKWENGTPINADSYIYSMQQILNPRMRNRRAEQYYAGEAAVAGGLKYYNSGTENQIVSYDKVGCYKVDDYTIRYVCQTALERSRFLTYCTSSWLVYEDYYEKGKDTAGQLVTTDYNSKIENTMSCGPYKIASLKPGKQIVLVQNENWYDWEKINGQLVSFTDFLVDGKSVQQYQTTKIVMDVISEPATAKEAFLQGKLTHWSPGIDDLITYSTSDRMYKADETYTMSFFFNADESALKEMDRSKGNLNSIVLSNTNFRKAMSLAIDRADLVTATAGYTPAYTIMNDLYYYDVHNDPASSYRKSHEAMQAICNLYGVSYGPGTPYTTLSDAYRSISGHNLAEAKALMAAACDELVQAGLYTKGEDIKIQIGWSKGAMTTADEAQITKLEQYFNAAAEGSGFGKIDLIGVGNIHDRYAAVPAGEYAMGWGAWGGNAYYPFRNFQVYCDTEQYKIHEAACWDPAAETLTLTVSGKEETMTWQDWSRCLLGNGKFANADFKVKLQITAAMEEAYLKKYYRIPVCNTAVCSMLAYKASYYTEDYNLMYGWGGLRLMRYHYNDKAWQVYIDAQGGQLSYQ